NHFQGPTTPGKLSQNSKDWNLEGSEGGYGGPGISNTTNQAVGSSQAEGPTRDPSTGHYKVKLTTQPASGERGRRREDMEDVASDVAETAKAAAVGALETGLKLGEIAKQAVDGMWDVAKKTTERVRDTVADDGNGNKQRRGEDLRGGPRGYN
ncbi:hypothetical protein PHJA_000109900, partial [Phtheirospermum japonicum]